MNSMNLVNTFSNSLFLMFVVGIPFIAWLCKVDVFASFTQGAKDGFAIAVKIIPALVGMLVAIGMFRAAGGFELLAAWLQPLLSQFGFPASVLPLALIRPFSGSAATGMLAELAHHHGGNSYPAHLAAIITGSTETTFYIVAVYFGSVAIRRTRYAIPAGLFADFIGVVAAVLVVHLLN